TQSPDERRFPVASITLTGEWLISERFAVATLANFPTTPVRKFVNGEVTEEFASMALAVGVRMDALSFSMTKRSRVALQFAALGGRTFGSTERDQLFPLLVARVHFLAMDQLALALGGAYAFSKDNLGIVYTVGYRF